MWIGPSQPISLCLPHNTATLFCFAPNTYFVINMLVLTSELLQLMIPVHGILFCSFYLPGKFLFRSYCLLREDFPDGHMRSYSPQSLISSLFYSFIELFSIWNIFFFYICSHIYSHQKKTHCRQGLSCLLLLILPSCRISVEGRQRRKEGGKEFKSSHPYNYPMWYNP